MYKIIAGLFLVWSVSTASAADLTERFGGSSGDWSGVYVGGLLGYAEVTDFNGFIEDRGDGKVFGVIIGYNTQLDENIVVGIEAEWSRYDIGFEIASAIRIENGGSVRGRVGYAHNNILFFTNAGMSYATTNINLSDTGFVIGAGIDYKVTDNIILGVEFQHSMYRNFDNANIDADFEVVRARLSYKFP